MGGVYFRSFGGASGGGGGSTAVVVTPIPLASANLTGPGLPFDIVDTFEAFIVSIDRLCLLQFAIAGTLNAADVGTSLSFEMPFANQLVSPFVSPLTWGAALNPSPTQRGCRIEMIPGSTQVLIAAANPAAFGALTTWAVDPNTIFATGEVMFLRVP